MPLLSCGKEAMTDVMSQTGLRRAASDWFLKLAFGVRGQFQRGHGPSRKSFDDVVVCPFRNGARAAVIVSADFELGWAWQIREREECESIGVRERENVPYIVQVLEQFGIPITWATVGHLFLESCTRGACGRPHPEMPRPPRNDLWAGEWYRYDPCSDLKKAPGWYAPDLIARIQESKVPHEIGTHSFSHIDFSSATSTPELVARELEACRAAMRPFGAQPRALVFCFNHMGYQHSDELARLGVTAVRHRDRRFRLAYPERTDSGMYKLYESMNLRLAGRYNYADKARLFIDEAIRSGAAYHLWFHPSDERAVFEQAFVPILQYVERKRRENLVWPVTMGQLAAYCEARERVQIRVRREQQRLRLDLMCDLDTARYGETDLTLLIPLERPPNAKVLEVGFVN